MVVSTERFVVESGMAGNVGGVVKFAGGGWGEKGPNGCRNGGLPGWELGRLGRVIFENSRTKSAKKTCKRVN